MKSIGNLFVFLVTSALSADFAIYDQLSCRMSCLGMENNYFSNP